jgi:hypothetical protein
MSFIMNFSKRTKDNQNIDGNHNQQAGRDIIINHYPIQQKHIPSAIEKVLSGLYKRSIETVDFVPPDNQPYTIKAKIEFNKITQYNEYYEDFMEICPLIEAQLVELVKIDPGGKIGLFHYIKSIYRDILKQHQGINKNADSVIDEMRCFLENDLANCHANLTREEQKAVEYIIFYVFKECGIFIKPPTDYDPSKS